MRFKCIIVMFVLPMLCLAQYYNPYAQAYEYGRQLAQQQQANQQAYNWGAGLALVQQGYGLIASGDYEEAFAKFEEAHDVYDFIQASECLGVCYELGIGTERIIDYADAYYEEGAQRGDAGCKAAIKRINNNGHWAASYRQTYLRNFRANYQAQYGAGGNYAPSYNSGSSSKEWHTCSTCNGSGRCKHCNNGYYQYGQNGKCGVCRGTGRCAACGGTGGWNL